MYNPYMPTVCNKEMSNIRIRIQMLRFQPSRNCKLYCIFLFPDQRTPFVPVPSPPPPQVHRREPQLPLLRGQEGLPQSRQLGGVSLRQPQRPQDTQGGGLPPAHQSQESSAARESVVVRLQAKDVQVGIVFFCLPNHVIQPVQSDSDQ